MTSANKSKLNLKVREDALMSEEESHKLSKHQWWSSWSEKETKHPLFFPDSGSVVKKNLGWA